MHMRGKTICEFTVIIEGLSQEQEDKLQRRLKLRMAAIPLVIITLDLVVTPLVVSTIMKGKPFQFQFSGLRSFIKTKLGNISQLGGDGRGRR